MTEQPTPFFLIVADHDQGFFRVEGPMTDDRPWRDAAMIAFLPRPTWIHDRSDGQRTPAKLSPR
jgi:hypothetical protein